MLRSLWRRIFGAPVRERYPSIHAPIERVPSPVPWIDDPIWSRWLWDRQFADLSEEAEWETLPEVRLYVATPADRARARVAPIREGVPVPAEGTFNEHKALLRSTPPAPGIQCASWPICCERLTALVHEQGTGVDINELESQIGPLDHAYIQEELIEGQDKPRVIQSLLSAGYRDSLAIARQQSGADGLLLHQCRACGRVYVGSCHP
jgi:hypothetical protein